jgi:hypothetical protein
MLLVGVDVGRDAMFIVFRPSSAEHHYTTSSTSKGYADFVVPPDSKEGDSRNDWAVLVGIDCCPYVYVLLPESYSVVTNVSELFFAFGAPPNTTRTTPTPLISRKLPMAVMTVS